MAFFFTPLQPQQSPYQSTFLRVEFKVKDNDVFAVELIGVDAVPAKRKLCQPWVFSPLSLLFTRETPAQKMRHGKKLTPNLDKKITNVLNLTVLQRTDPLVEEILITASHVAFYELNVDSCKWCRTDVKCSFL